MDSAARILRIRLAACVGIFLLVAGTMLNDFVQRPGQSLRPFVGVFGSNPLGLHNVVAATLAVSIGILPLIVMMWHGITLVAALSAIGQGSKSSGILSLIIRTVRNRTNPNVWRPAKAMLLALAGFIVIVMLWIIATDRAGV